MFTFIEQTLDRCALFNLILVIVVASTCGCRSSGRSIARPAVLDDVTGKPPFVSNHAVVAVDGKPVKRAKDAFVTVIPMVELEPGTHTLTLRLADRDGIESTVTGYFEAGKYYRVKSEHNGLSIVERDDNGKPSDNR